MKRTTLKALNTVAALGLGTVAHAQDEVDTRIGKLRLNQGLPTKDLGDKLYDEIDLQRAVRRSLDSLIPKGYAATFDGVYGNFSPSIELA